MLEIKLQRQLVHQQKQDQQQDRPSSTGWRVFFIIMNEITHLFDEPPHFYKYTEADETMGSILRHQLPTQDVWNNLIQLLLNQSRVEF